ncbi:hypothetical protein JG687_00014671, partial [Phytophthora cactorum]
MLTISPVKIVRTGSRLQYSLHMFEMRLGQFMLLATVALLTSSEYFAIATADNTRKFLSFEDVDYEAKSTKEERVSAAAKAAAEGGRIGAGDTGTVVSTSANGGGTVTVTVYNNNGLWQRIKRWWLKLISSEERASSASAVTSGEGGRAGAGGTVVSSSNGNGGGTITVSVFNNNGLFQKIESYLTDVLSFIQ